MILTLLMSMILRTGHRPQRRPRNHPKTPPALNNRIYRVDLRVHQNQTKFRPQTGHTRQSCTKDQRVSRYDGGRNPRPGRRHGFQVTLNPTRDALIVWPDDPPPDLVDLLRSAKPQIVAAFKAERGRINHWIAHQIIDWPPTSCLNCRKPIIPGQRWTAVSSGEATARFHEVCHSEWLGQQEIAARKAMGLNQRETTP
jgi:hypothetical protein